MRYMSERDELDPFKRTVRLPAPLRRFDFTQSEAERLVRTVADRDDPLAWKIQQVFDVLASGGPYLFDPSPEDMKTMCEALSAKEASLDEASAKLLSGLREDDKADCPA